MIQWNSNVFPLVVQRVNKYLKMSKLKVAIKQQEENCRHKWVEGGLGYIVDMHGNGD